SISARGYPRLPREATAERSRPRASEGDAMSSASSSILKQVGYVELPEHTGSGGFDHAAVHSGSGHVYVAHTANNEVAVFDPLSREYLFSVPDLPGVAGVLVSNEAQLIIASNRSENTVAVFPPGADPRLSKLSVGVRPNGLAYDHARRQILVANVGDLAIPGSHTLTVVGLEEWAVRAQIPVSGRTRWAVYDPDAQEFYVNIADPPEIAVVDARHTDMIARTFTIPSACLHAIEIALNGHSC